MVVDSISFRGRWTLATAGTLLAMCMAAGAAGAEDANPAAGVDVGGFVAPSFDRPKLSPDGKLVAVVRVSQDRPYLDVISLEGGDEQIAPYSLGVGNGIAAHEWVDNRTLLVEIRYGDEFWVRDDVNRGGHHLVDIKTRKVKRLFEKSARNPIRPGALLKLQMPWFADSFVVNAFDQFPGAASVIFPDERSSWVSRYELARGRYEKLAEVSGDVWDAYVDRQGRVLAAWGHPEMSGVTFKDRVQLFHRPHPSSDWSIALAGGFDDHDVDLLGPGSRDRTAYVLENATGDTLALSELDLSNGKLQPVFRASRTDVLTARRDAKGRVYAVRHDDHFPQWHYPAGPGGKALPAAVIHASAAKAEGFKEKNVEIVSFARDADAMILRVSGDRDPGTYYLTSLSDKGLKVLAKRFPEIDADELVARHPVEFAGPDGSRLTGYVSLPKGVKKGQRVPFVVLRGPQLFPKAQTWGWDREAQFFASQGLGVLRVNARGTLGFGREFHRAGVGRLPTAVPADTLAGVRHAVANLAADPARVCLVGRGWGAYTALMTAIQEPDAIRCVVAIAGAYSPARERLALPVRGARERYSGLVSARSRNDEAFREVSIPHIAARIRTPLLMVEARQFSERLSSAARDMIRELDQHEVAYVLHDEATSRPGNLLSLTARRNAYARAAEFVLEHTAKR